MSEACVYCGSTVEIPENGNVLCLACTLDEDEED